MKKTVVYEMRRDGWLDYFEMHVSPNSKEMRSYIEFIAKRGGWEVPADKWEETRGMVHPMHSVAGPFAYLFLAEDYLGVGVISHECLHIAMAHERWVLRFGMGYGVEIGDDEERLGYFLSSAVRGVYNTLYENKHIKVNP